MPPQVLTFEYVSGSNNPQQQLDLYLPAGQPAQKLLVYFHGGAWISDDKAEARDLGLFFASRGVAVVNVNYRLSGKESSVHHPDHVRDCAAALRWLELHAHEHRLPTSFYLMGFSAGAQLVGLLSLDRSYGAPTHAIRGIIGIEGIYDLPLLAKTFPTYEDWFLALAFGKDPKVRETASPRSRPVHDGPPWLLVQSTGDELVDAPQTERFAEHLRAGGVKVTVLNGLSSKHYDVIRAVGRENDPTTQAILAFLGVSPSAR